MTQVCAQQQEMRGYSSEVNVQIQADQINISERNSNQQLNTQQTAYFVTSIQMRNQEQPQYQSSSIAENDIERLDYLLQINQFKGTYQPPPSSSSQQSLSISLSSSRNSQRKPKSIENTQSITHLQQDSNDYQQSDRKSNILFHSMSFQKKKNKSSMNQNGSRYEAFMSNDDFNINQKRNSDSKSFHLEDSKQDYQRHQTSSKENNLHHQHISNAKENQTNSDFSLISQQQMLSIPPLYTMQLQQKQKLLQKEQQAKQQKQQQQKYSPIKEDEKRKTKETVIKLSPYKVNDYSNLLHSLTPIAKTAQPISILPTNQNNKNDQNDTNDKDNDDDLLKTSSSHSLSNLQADPFQSNLPSLNRRPPSGSPQKNRMKTNRQKMLSPIGYGSIFYPRQSPIKRDCCHLPQHQLDQTFNSSYMPTSINFFTKQKERKINQQMGLIQQSTTKKTSNTQVTTAMTTAGSTSFPSKSQLRRKSYENQNTNSIISKSKKAKHLNIIIRGNVKSSDARRNPEQSLKQQSRSVNDPEPQDWESKLQSQMYQLSRESKLLHESLEHKKKKLSLYQKTEMDTSKNLQQQQQSQQQKQLSQQSIFQINQVFNSYSYLENQSEQTAFYQKEMMSSLSPTGKSNHKNNNTNKFPKLQQ